MAIHPTRTNRECGSQSRRCCGRCDTYLNDVPVRDINPGPGPSYCEGNCVAPVTQIRPPVERDMNYHTNMPCSQQLSNPCMGSPPMGRYDLYDLRYDQPNRRWYWIPNVRDGQQAPIRQPAPIIQQTPIRPQVPIGPQLPIRPQIPIRPQYRSSYCCEKWRNCCYRKRRPEYQQYTNSYLQTLYRTPSGSNIILNHPPFHPVQQKQPFSPLHTQEEIQLLTQPPLSPPHGAVPITDPACGENCPARQTKRKRHKVCRVSCPPSPSESSNDCTCDDAQAQQIATGCPCLTNFMNPMCCPCRQMDCSCLQNVCCPCAINLQRQHALKPVKKPVKKKAKCSRCCCTQTQNTCKDKAVVTNLVQVSDACVCCKPKEKKKPPKPANKTCCICQRPNMCPARCCPCLLRMCPPQGCCTGQAGCEAEEREESDPISRECPHILECRREANCKPTNCNRCCDPENCDSTVYDLIKGCNDRSCPAQNVTTNWLQTHLTNPDTTNASWINDVLLKKSLPTIKQKHFNTDHFASPLTGNTYNVNMVRIKNRHYKNYATLDPFPTDEAIEELRKAVEHVKGDPEHRYLVTAVCDALLNNKTKSSFEGGDSCFLDEYTYMDQSNLLLAQLNPSDLYNKNKTVSNETLKHFPTSYNTFAQTSSDQLTFTPTVNAQTLTAKSSKTNKQLLTDPINSFFNEMTQTGVNELFEEYMKKIRHSKLFPSIDNAIQSEQNIKTSTESCCKMTDFDILKDMPSQCDKKLDAISTNKKQTVVQEKLKTSIPIFKPKYSKTEQKQETLEDSITRKKQMATIKNESHSDTDSGVDQNMVSVKHAAAKQYNQDYETNKPTSSSGTNTKRKRPASASDGGTKAISATSKEDHSIDRSFNHHKSCINSESSVTSLPIRCPRNKKSDEGDHLVNKPPSMTLKNSSSPYVKPSAPLDETNLNKKRKMLPKQYTQNRESKKKVEPQTDKLQNFSKLKSKIPIICPNKFRSLAERANIGSSSLKSSDVLKQIETTISGLSFVGGKPDKQENLSKVETKSSELEDLYISDGSNEDSESFEYVGKYKEPFNSHVVCDETNNSDGEDDHYEAHINTYNKIQPNRRDDTKQLVSSISNSEIVISNIKYDSDSNLKVHHDDSEPVEDFTFDFLLENQKSVLSMIKEETESDVNISIPSSTKFLDINTSPFDFEIAHHNFVDSCNSPFELIKQKDRRHSRLSCFSSQEEGSEPYKAAGSGSANEEGERPRTARGIRWLFNL